MGETWHSNANGRVSYDVPLDVPYMEVAFQDC